MRNELDTKLLELGECRLMKELGNNLVKRLSFYIRMLHTSNAESVGRIALELIKSSAWDRN